MEVGDATIAIAMSTTTLATHIISEPGVCGGLPRIEGTRIRVLDIVALHRRGLSPVEIDPVDAECSKPHATVCVTCGALPI